MSDTPSSEASATDSPRWPLGLSGLEAFVLLILLTLVSTTFPGYRYGDSNHGITVPIVKRLMDPTLYPGDIMVATAEGFPTVFYRLLAAALPGTDWVPLAFFVLYVVAIAATLGGAYRLGRWAGGPAAGVVAMLFVYPVRVGLAGEAIFRVAFSHSHLASALVIWAVVWFLEGRRLLPLLLLSLGAYNHLLYSAYMLVPMTLVVLLEARRSGTRRTVVLLSAAIVPLLPLVGMGLARSTALTPEWLSLLKARSAHHSFPSFFGGDLPDAAGLLALAVLSVSTLDLARRRLFAVFLAGTALLFVFGTYFTEFHPVKAVLQLQPHRCWRFEVLILYGLIAAGLVSGVRSGGIARLGAIITGIVVFTPGLESLLPVVVVVQAIAGSPTPATWARLAAVGILLGVDGWGERKLAWDFAGEALSRLLNQTVFTCSALAVSITVAMSLTRRRRVALGVATLMVTLLWAGPDAYRRARARWTSGPWYDVQKWVRASTPRSAVLLTPPSEAGFRVFSERTVVGEWKDGTQQYFDDAFVSEWDVRMKDLGGDHFVNLPDDRLLFLARRYGASFIVLPANPVRSKLVSVYRNRAFAVYRAQAAG